MEYEAFVQSPVRIMPQRYENFIGLDVDKKKISVTVLNWEGIVSRKTLPNEPRAFAQYVKNAFPGSKPVLVYEVGPTGYGLFDALHDEGYDCLVTAPVLIPQAPNHRRVKTNRLDSERLAMKLRGGELKGIRVPSPLYRDLRHYARRYLQVSKAGTRVKQRIKSLLLAEGLAFPVERGTYTREAITMLKKLPCREVLGSILRQHVGELEYFLEKKNQIKGEVRKFIERYPELKRNFGFLKSLPGIGNIVGFLSLARIGDWRLIQRTSEVPSFLGICPSEYSTGDRTVRGSITRLGDRELRNMLIESAWTAIHKDAELMALYTRLSWRERHSNLKRKAIVAVARKLGERIGSVLKGQRRYVIRKSPEKESA